MTALLAAAAVSVAFAACGGSSDTSSSDNSTGSTTAKASADVLKLGAVTDITSFDPAQSDVGHYMQYLQPVYDSLVRIDESGEIRPMLATSFKYVDPAKLKLVLELRKGVSFSDGTPFNAKAVVASLERFKKANGPRASALINVKKISAVDDHTVEIELSSPDPSLVYNLGLVAGMITSPGAKQLSTQPVGTGPYVLDPGNSTPGDHYTFTRNEKYYEPEALPYDEIVIRPIGDPKALLNAVKTGQVDGAYGLPDQVEEAESAGLNVVSSPGDWQGLFIIDREGKTTPALADVRVRQAINYALDGDAILDVLAFGRGMPTTQIFYPDTPAYDPDLNDRYPYDPEKAKQLLAEAGYGDGLKIPMPSSAFMGDVYPVIKQQLGEVGIEVEYTTISEASGITPFVSGEFPMYMFSWGASNNWLDATLLLSPEGAWNPLHVKDPKIVAMMKKIATANGAEQAKLFRELSAYVVDQAWFAPFYTSENLYFASEAVEVTPEAQQVVPSIRNYVPAA